MVLDLIKFLTGFVLSGATALIVEEKDMLTISGIVASIALGTVMYGLGGAAWLGALLAFFMSSSILSNMFPSIKAQVNREQIEKAGARDMWQVIANGGISSLLTAAYFLDPQPIYFVAFLGVLAAVNADTWATEIGAISKTVPRMITTFKRVERGLSGGITPLGTFASFAGALFMAASGVILALLFQPEMLYRIPWQVLVVTVTLGGFGGALFDSVLGATVQVKYYCPSCRKITEQRTHHCGTKTLHHSGIELVDNDFVNLAASVFGGLFAALLYMLI